MPKRKPSERDGDREAEPRQKQLYLILDDWSLGYTIREVNLPSGPSHPAAVSGEVAEQRLPPPFLRVAAPRELPHFFAYAFGTSIIAAHPPDCLSVGSPEAFLPILDVRKRSFMFGPSLGHTLSPIFVPVGRSRLFALHSNCLQLLRRAPRQPPPGSYNPVEWDWSLLPKAPFLSKQVTSYAVHPDGPSIIFSAKRYYSSKGGTFTFHAKKVKKLVWTKRSEWKLPFAGQAHFDGDLGIFVGLSRKNRGHLCFCDKTSLNPGNTDEWPAPAWKLCLEKLFSDNPHERHVSATLIYLGSNSEFCLVECLFFEDVTADDQVIKEEGKHEDVTADDQMIDEGGKLEEGGKGRGRHSCYVYRLMKFSLTYEKGDLTATSHWVQYYEVPEETSESIIKHPPVAFCL